MIELEQSPLTDLTRDAHCITPLSAINPDEHFYWSPDVHDENCIFVEDKFCNFDNTGDAVTFSDHTDDFWLNMISDVSVKTQPFGEQTWLMFATHNVRILQKIIRTQKFQDSMFYMQKFKLHLHEQTNIGWFQLYSLPQFMRYNGSYYGSRSLLTIFVYRNRYVKESNPSPLLYSISPKCKHTYLPIFKNQYFQLIMPENTRSALRSEHLDGISRVVSEEKVMCDGDKPIVSLFLCKKTPTTSQVMRFKCKNFHNDLIIPGLRADKDKQAVYAVLNEPLENAYIYCQNLDGLIVKSHKNQHWLLDRDMCSMSSYNKDEILIEFKVKIAAAYIKKICHFLWLLPTSAFTVKEVL